MFFLLSRPDSRNSSVKGTFASIDPIFLPSIAEEVLLFLSLCLAHANRMKTERIDDGG